MVLRRPAFPVQVCGHRGDEPAWMKHLFLCFPAFEHSAGHMSQPLCSGHWDTGFLARLHAAGHMRTPRSFLKTGSESPALRLRSSNMRCLASAWLCRSALFWRGTWFRCSKHSETCFPARLHVAGHTRFPCISLGTCSGSSLLRFPFVCSGVSDMLLRGRAASADPFYTP